MTRLASLKSKLEASSYAEVVKNALMLYEAIVIEVENGSEIMVKNKDGQVAPYKILLK